MCMEESDAEIIFIILRRRKETWKNHSVYVFSSLFYIIIFANTKFCISNLICQSPIRVTRINKPRKIFSTSIQGIKL